MTAPIFVPPKTLTVVHKDQNEYVIWNPCIHWKITRAFNWNTGICVKKVFCFFEKLLVVCFLIVGDFCVLSANSMSIYLSSWPYPWNNYPLQAYAILTQYSYAQEFLELQKKFCGDIFQGQYTISFHCYFHFTKRVCILH